MAIAIAAFAVLNAFSFNSGLNNNQAFSFAASMNVYRQSPAAFKSNPYDELGVAHNALLDYVDKTLDDGGRPSRFPDDKVLWKVLREGFSSREFQVLMGKSGFQLKDYGFTESEGLLKRAVPKGFYKNPDEQGKVAKLLHSLGRIMFEMPKPRSLNLKNDDPYWKNLDRIRRFERVVLGDQSLSERARLSILGACAVARYSAYYWMTGNDSAKSSELSERTIFAELNGIGCFPDAPGKGWLKSLAQTALNMAVEEITSFAQNVYDLVTWVLVGKENPYPITYGGVWFTVGADVAGYVGGAIGGFQLGAAYGGIPGSAIGAISGSIIGGSWLSWRSTRSGF